MNHLQGSLTPQGLKEQYATQAQATAAYAPDSTPRNSGLMDRTVQAFAEVHSRLVIATNRAESVADRAFGASGTGSQGDQQKDTVASPGTAGQLGELANRINDQFNRLDEQLSRLEMI